MWLLVRCTARRAIFSSAILRRVLRARRRRDSFLSMISPLLLLGFLDDNRFVVITHALALVRFRRTVRTNFGSHLANHLFVDALDDDLGLARSFDLDAGRHVMHHGVREAKGQVQLVALGLGTVTHANQ